MPPKSPYKNTLPLHSRYWMDLSQQDIGKANKLNTILLIIFCLPLESIGHFAL